MINVAFDCLRESGTVGLDAIWLVGTEYVALRILRTWTIATVDATAAEATNSLLIDVVIVDNVWDVGEEIDPSDTRIYYVWEHHTSVVQG